LWHWQQQIEKMDEAELLDREDFALDGEELEEYCKNHGLCNLCAQTKTHKRVFRLKKKNKWQPLTTQTLQGGYLVYKGFCLKPGCFTLEQAKRMLGETSPSGEIMRGVVKGKKKGKTSRLLRKKKGTKSSESAAGNLDAMTGISGFSDGRPKKMSSRSSNRSTTRSLSSEIRRDDDDISVASAMTTMTSQSKVRMSLKELLKEHGGQVLDVSSTRLHHVHITELINSLKVADTLQALILEGCRLNDNEIEVIGNGLAVDYVNAPLKRLSFRSNRMGNRGAVSLQEFFRKTRTLEELDLSKNQIGSRGASSTLHAFRSNSSTKIKMINLAHNEIWDPDDGSFFATNTTIELLNLEGNFIHDEGIEAIARGIWQNRGTNLERLYLGWNGIGDDGCIQLAKMLESNTKLVTLGLGENDITSIGARAILASMASNSTLKEITGLYHNQIDRKFIIVAIKQLLQSNNGGSTEPKSEENSILEESLAAMETLAEPLGSKLPPPNEEGSEGSLDWAEKLYTVADTHGAQVHLVDNDGGEATEQAPALSKAENGVNGHAKDEAVFKELPAPVTDFDRLMVFQSAPLAYFNRETSLYLNVPLQNFDHERTVLKNSVKEAERFEATIQVEVEAGKLGRLRTFFEKGTSRVLHLSCYGHPEQLTFENGTGSVEILEVEELRSLVQSAKCPLQLVVVNSFYSGRIGRVFLEAGVPHVVCCHHTETFRDKAASHFTKNLYHALASNKSLKQAFHLAKEAVRINDFSKNIDRYVLLPQKAENDFYHDIPVFFTKPVPPSGIMGNPFESMPHGIIPHLPKHFIGREVDMFEILEALRVDDVVRVGGSEGTGKFAVVAAVCRYINQRRKMFNFDQIFWLPTGKDVHPEPDTLFGDLVELTTRMLNGEDVWEDEEALLCGERIQVELEGMRTLLAIDSRKFNTEMSSLSLERFIGDLLNNSAVDVKVILITSARESFEEGESDTIHLGPINFKSTSLLFGEVSRFITANGCPAAQSPDEFAALMVPPSISKLQDESKFSSSRRTDLMSMMGDGNPKWVIRAAKTMPAPQFIAMIGRANAPEVRVDSNQSLRSSISKWSSQRDSAVANKNYLRAADLEKVLVELDDLSSQFPSVENLQKQEQELQKKLAAAMANKQYRDGNNIKREILGLKRLIMQEKRSSSAEQEITAANRMDDLKKQMANIMKIAKSSSFSEMDNIANPEVVSGTFTLGTAYHNCELCIYPGNVLEFDPGDDLGAAVCWTNECCDLKNHERGQAMTEWGGRYLAKDISSLPGITRTRWGLAKCGSGNAVIVGPGNYEDLLVHCIILAVGPLSPNCDDVFEADDEDSLHYISIMLRSCIRSCLILAKHSQVQSLAFPPITTRMGGATYEQTLRMGFKAMVEEAKHSDLNTLHIVASTEEEASKLIAMALDMGLAMQK